MPTTDLSEELETILSSIRSTLGAHRARLYRMDATGLYRLAASSGFSYRFLPDDVLSPGTPLLEWAQRARKAAFANSPREAGALAPAMEQENYARALAAPIYVGSRMAGLLELQDKARGEMFEDADLARLEGPLSRLGALLTEHDTTQVAAPEALDPEDAKRLFLEPPRRRAERFPPPPPLFHTAAEGIDDVGGASPIAPLLLTPSGLSTVAPAEAGRGSGGSGIAPSALSRRDAAVFLGFASALLLGPDVEAVIFSTWSPRKAELRVFARRVLSQEARAALLSDLQKALSAASPDLRAPAEKLFHSDYPLGREEGEIRETAGIQTSAIEASGGRALLFTILFARAPSREQTEALRETHRLVRSAVLDARAAVRYRVSYRSLVSSLLEPGVRPYPQLKAHALAVGLLSRRLAEALRLPTEAVEQVTVAGLLHDIGLRELALPYERFSGRRPLDAEEIEVVRGHAAAGSEVLRRIEFPYPVAPLVRHHHERFDGAGYPDQLAGKRIPLGSRIIAIAEAWDAMTAPHSYRAPIPEEDALQIILRKGGTQFDPDLVLRFRDLIRGLP
jgi:putative nucleotidyltransferase with HDIG domain